MTTKIIIEPAGHHVLITITDNILGNAIVETKLLQPAIRHVDGHYVPTGQGPVQLYATATRQITVVDLEPDDARITDANARDNRPDP